MKVKMSVSLDYDYESEIIELREGLSEIELKLAWLDWAKKWIEYDIEIIPPDKTLNPTQAQGDS